MSGATRKALSGIFTKAAACLAVAWALSGCTTTPWAGGPGLGEDRISEPLLEPIPLNPADVVVTPTTQTISKGLLTQIDSALRGDRGFSVNEITFPGSRGTKEKAYLLLPDGEGPFPLAVVMPTLSDDQSVSEVHAKEMARRGYAALRIVGYYLDLDNINSAEAAMNRFRYTILDARMLLDVVKTFPKIDSESIAATGVSLGGIMSATLMGLDENIDTGAFLLAGGGLAQILYDSEEKTIETFRENLFSDGLATVLTGGLWLPTTIVGSEVISHTAHSEKDSSIAELRDKLMQLHNLQSREEFLTYTSRYTFPLDPSRYAGSLDPCRTMILSGTRDDVIPEARTRALWKRLGKPEWNKVISDHYTFALYFYWATQKAAALFDRVLKDGVCEKPAVTPPASSPKP